MIEKSAVGEFFNRIGRKPTLADDRFQSRRHLVLLAGPSSRRAIHGLLFPAGFSTALRSLATRGPKHPAGPPRRSPGRLAPQRFHDAAPAATSKSAAASADLSIANS